MEVRHANAIQAWWLIAPPSPMTALGFSRALGIHLGLNFDAVGIVHHNVEWLSSQESIWRNAYEGGLYREGDKEQKKVGVFSKLHIPQQVQGATYINQDDHIAGGFSKGLQPTMRCHAENSLVLRMDAFDPIDIEAVNQFLWSGRYAGGAIADHLPVKVFDTLDEAVRGIGTGFAVTDRSDIVQSIMNRDSVDGTQALIMALAGDIPLDASGEPEKWLSANVVGYAALETPKKRVGVRLPKNQAGIGGDCLHVYGEPIVGLVQYRSIRVSKALPLWSNSHDPENGVFLSVSSFSL
jgi:hypothetical protein